LALVEKTVLLVGRAKIVLDDVRRHVPADGITWLSATTLEEVKAAFTANAIDVTVMGAGLELETRLAVVRHAFEVSDSTTVHLKDKASGAEGMLPFVEAVLRGLVGRRGRSTLRDDR
jgi:uncharacterized protein with ATP-grasp and redox domains